jgi:hypothetical protein
MASPSIKQLALRVQDLTWRHDGDGWQLFAGRRRMGRVERDALYAGMWRSRLADGQLSDMANLSRAKSAVLDAAARELAFEHRQRSANHTPEPQQKGDVFQAASSSTRPNRVEVYS